MWILVSRTSRASASPRRVILCTGEIIAFQHRPSAFVTLSSKKRLTLRRTCQHVNPRDITTCNSLLHLSKMTVVPEHLLTCYTVGYSHGRISCSHVYSPVRAWALNLVCTATVLQCLSLVPAGKCRDRTSVTPQTISSKFFQFVLPTYSWF
jgi:hypothetical protein